MAEVAGSNPAEPIFNISNDSIEKYLDIIRISGVTEKHIKEVRRALKSYQKYILFEFDYNKTIEYFNFLREHYSISYFKKQTYQIKKFLKQNGVDWIQNIKLPQEQNMQPKRVTIEDICSALDLFKKDTNYKRIRALILLGFTSGLRAEEIYKLNPKDIDLDNRTVYVIHDSNPQNNHTTKTKKSRISFFNLEAQKALRDIIHEIEENCTIFPQSTFTKKFRNSKIKVKDLRKAFSQQWTRRNGNTQIKKILMGHSIRNDVDLNHYNYQSQEDLKKIYDEVFGDLKIT